MRRRRVAKRVVRLRLDIMVVDLCGGGWIRKWVVEEEDGFSLGVDAREWLQILSFSFGIRWKGRVSTNENEWTSTRECKAASRQFIYEIGMRRCREKREEK